MRVARAALPQDKNDHVGGKSLNKHIDRSTYEFWPIAQGPEGLHLPGGIQGVRGWILNWIALGDRTFEFFTS